MTEGRSKRLVIDLEACDQCDRCAIECAYFYKPQPEDHGVLALRESATFDLVCRRCRQASCIEACPCSALERQPSGVIRRYNLRCVSCKSCAHACPFGTIYEDMLGFYRTPCDHCLSRSLDTAPPCVGSCRCGAIEYRLVDAEEPGVHIVDEHLAARAPKWLKQEAAS
jgi:Fe-S-cluster-containing dehydrogenase component